MDSLNELSSAEYSNISGERDNIRKEEDKIEDMTEWDLESGPSEKK